MTGSPKLGDVAKAAKLSSAAVSRYLNGSLRLPPETARHIDAAVQFLDYRPHAHARSLSRGRSDTIGLLLPDIANPSSPVSPPWSRRRPTPGASP